MNRLFSILVVLVWGVWVGSLVGVFLAVTSLARTFPPRVDGAEASSALLFGNAASGVFGLFEQVQLGLAAAGLTLAFAWRLCRGAAGQKTALFVLFALATASAVTETAYVSKEINQMRMAQETQSDRFKRFHGLSFGLYSLNILLLAAGGTILPFAIARAERQRGTTGTTTNA
jgi:hypothetical protein